MVPDGTAAESTAAGTDGRPTVRALVTIYLKGMAMGAADTVPGVSGGTIALITGIYERLIAALTGLDPRLLGRVPGLHRAATRRAFASELRETDVPFLVALGLGVVTSIVALSRVVHGALEAYPAETYAFFLGLIAASAVVLYGELDVRTAGQIGAGIAGFALAFLLSGASSGGLLAHSLPVVLVAGAVAITATVLPGVSGAFLLLLLGQYEYLTGVLTSFVDRLLGATADGGAGLVDLAAVIAAFGVGAVVGLFTTAHLIRRALDAYRMATLTFLVSLMVGSLRLPAVEIAEGIGTWTPQAGAGVAVTALVGAVAVLAVDRYTVDLDFDAAG